MPGCASVGRVRDGSLASLALVAVAGVHAGFQLVVMVLVYPGFREVPADGWAGFHAAHSRRIAPLVGVVYVALVAGCAWGLLATPEAWTVVAAGIAGATVLVTAALAAPLHGRLDRGRDAGPDRAVLGRLLVVDRVRAGLALACLVASVGAPLSGR